MGKTDTSATAYKQQSIILIPMDTPGITIVRLVVSLFVLIFQSY